MVKKKNKKIDKFCYELEIKQMIKKLKVFECYAGYGGCSFGLEKANIDFEIVGYSEIKDSVIEIYNKNHYNYKKGYKELIKNYGDITKIDPKDLPNFDLISGGFPCQDVSLAGKRDLSKGRTMSVFDMLEIIRVKKPKYCILENVKGIFSIRGGDLLREIIRELKAMGYAVSYKILNTLEHGIPQNRERVFICCERGINNFGFNPFPKKEPLNLLLKDLLEDDVDEKYYLDEKNYESLKKSLIRRGKDLKNLIRDKSALCLMSRHPSRCFHDTTLIVQKPRGFNKGGVHKVCPTIGCNSWQHNNYLLKDNRLRILTPKETFRLMGFVNDDIDIDGFSDTQLYEASGNGWDVNLVSKIFERWLK